MPETVYLLSDKPCKAGDKLQSSAPARKHISLSTGFHARSDAWFCGCPVWPCLPLDVTKTSSDISDRERLIHHMPHAHYIKMGM